MAKYSFEFKKKIKKATDFEKDGKFVQHGLVGVCGYGRGRVGRKQAKLPKIRGFWGVSFYLLVV